jgi:hypothetical protein
MRFHRIWIIAAALTIGPAWGCSDDDSGVDARTDDAGGDTEPIDGDEAETTPTDVPDVEDVPDVQDAEDGWDGHCTTHDQCMDDLYCNGTERCIDGTCAVGSDPCDDTLDCTVDSCDEVEDRCSHAPDHDFCADDVPCNGSERCVPTSPAPGSGCSPGTRPDCNDGDPCTIDTCVNDRGGCVNDPRDLDRDTYVTRDLDCGGDDCNDGNAAINPGATEVCNDIFDNDCDTLADFADPSCRPVNDVCAGALTLAEGVPVVSSTRGTMHDYTLSCASYYTYTDVVFTFTTTEVRDIIVRITRSAGGTVYADLQTSCGVAASSLQCRSGSATVELRRNSQPAGTYYVVVEGSADTDFSIEYTTLEPSPIPPNDVCSGAIDVPAAGGIVTGTLLDTSNHYVPTCGSASYTYPDVFYRLVLTAPKRINISLTMNPTTSYYTYVALMTTCGDRTTEVACATGYTAAISRNFLDAGTYYIAVDSNLESAFTLTVTLSDPIYPPANDRCSGAINVSGGGLFVGNLADTYRDYPPSCSTLTLTDVVYSFTTVAPQDVTVEVTPIGASTTYAVAMRSTCDDRGTEMICRAGNPATFARRSLPAGTYYLIVSGPATGTGNRFLLSLSINAPTPVPPGDLCATAPDISAGGTFTSSTLGFGDDYAAVCGSTATYADLVYRITLAAPADLALTLTSSATTNYLDLRRGACGVGTVTMGCMSGAAPAVSARGLPAGDYWVLVDTSVEANTSLNVVFSAATPPSAACVAATPINVDYTSGSTFTYNHTGTTAGGTNNFTPVTCSTSSSAADAVYALNVPVRSSVSVRSDTTAGAYDGALYMRSLCDTPRSEFLCNDDCGSTRASCLPSDGGTVTLEPGTYYIVQDGYTSGTGAYTLTVSATRL